MREGARVARLTTMTRAPTNAFGVEVDVEEGGLVAWPGPTNTKGDRIGHRDVERLSQCWSCSALTLERIWDDADPIHADRRQRLLAIVLLGEEANTVDGGSCHVELLERSRTSGPGVSPFD